MNAISVILFIVGLIHIIPLKGILGITSLTALYGIEIYNNDVELLLRHRSVLFGIIGFGLIYSAFKTHCQLAGITIGLISTLSFNLLIISRPKYTTSSAVLFWESLHPKQINMSNNGVKYFIAIW